MNSSNEAKHSFPAKNYQPGLIKKISLFLLCTLLASSTVYSKSTNDSATRILSGIDAGYKTGKLSEKSYMDSINATMRLFLSTDIIFTNKETLQLLKLFRTIAWSNKNYYEYRRTYYAILSNQSQVAGRQGEMLYYGKKINDLEEEKNNRPSLAALSIIIDYYNTNNSYEHTRAIYNKNKIFLQDLAAKAQTGEMDIVDIGQATILLSYISQALYQLSDTAGGRETEMLIDQLATIANTKYKDEKNALATIRYAQLLAFYERGMVKKSPALIQKSFIEIDQLLSDRNTPEHLKNFIRFTSIDHKLAFYIKNKQIDSTAHYLKEFEDAYRKETISYNLYVRYKYIGQALYNEELYKRSADTLQLAIKVLDSSRSAIVSDINDMMYARAEAEEKEVLLAEADQKRKYTERKLQAILIGSGFIVILAGLLFLYFRQRQRNRFLQFKLNIARNIHDETNPALLYAKALVKTSRTDNTKTELEQHIEHTMELIRSLSHDLRSEKQHTLGDLVRYTETILKKLNIDGSTFRYTINSKQIDEKQFISHYQFDQLKAILSECITNTIKHADFRKIDISFIRNRKEFRITYKDDGKGWNNQTIVKGIGLKNIEERIRNLNGEWSLENKYPDGYLMMLSVILR